MNKQKIINEYVRKRNDIILSILKRQNHPISARDIMQYDNDLCLTEITRVLRDRNKTYRNSFRYSFERKLNDELREKVYITPRDTCNQYFFTERGRAIANNQDQIKRQEIIKSLIVNYNDNIIKDIDSNSKRVMKSGTIEYYANNISCLLYSLKAFDEFNIKNIDYNPFDKSRQLIYALTLCNQIDILGTQKLPTRYWTKKIEKPKKSQQEKIVKIQHTETKVGNICPNCDFVIDQDFAYCPKCGTLLK